MAICVHRLHLIWLGSIPPNTEAQPHRRRLLEWVQLNPDWEVFLWSDRIDRERIQLESWCHTNGIQYRSILDSGTVLWGNERAVVLTQIHEGFYANASDLLRLRILYQLGGLYVDSDVEPMSLSSIDLPLGLGLLLTQDQESNTLNSIAPHAIAAIQGHSVLQVALWQGVTNCSLLEVVEEPDFRKSTRTAERYGGTLVLTGDLLRPALRTVFGLFGATLWEWSPWLEALRMPIDFQHNEENAWLNSAGNSERTLFFPPELGLMIAQTWTDRPLTSILHLTAAYSASWMIEIAAQQVSPFENHFGFSPKGMASKMSRTEDVLKSIPSV